MKLKKLLALTEDGIRFGFLDPKDNLYHCLGKSEIESKYPHLLDCKVAHLGFEVWVPKNQSITFYSREGNEEGANSGASDVPCLGCVAVTFKEPKK